MVRLDRDYQVGGGVRRVRYQALQSYSDSMRFGAEEYYVLSWCMCVHVRYSGRPKLKRFMGRPKDLTPKARFLTLIGYATT